jgi:hypothetical protein
MINNTTSLHPRDFMPKTEWAIVLRNSNEDVCEEHDHFKQLIGKITGIINSMPKTYETDGQGDNAIVYLHYFMGGCDWYITERDMEKEQIQAFGLADLGYGGELGYINIEELREIGAELDLYWTPKPLKTVKAARG